MTDARQELKEVIMKYTEDKVVDLSKMRKEDRASYSKISYYYGSIDGMLQELELESKNKKHTGGSLEKPSVRNKLAYDMLNELLKDHTMEQIANIYGCSRMHVSQLLKSLKIAAGEDKEAN